VHRLPPQVKVLAALCFIVLVVATPPLAWQAFAWYAALVAGVAAVAGLRARTVLRRMAVELPFVAFALLMPLLGRPPTVEVLGVALSQPGLLAAWNILAKATLGVAVAVVLGATTAPEDLIAGLARLRVPALLVEIAGFMVRYADVVAEEWRRMTMARAARGFSATGVRSWQVLGRSAGVLFIRSYERGERVHRAMLARGYDGRMPDSGRSAAAAGEWAYGLALPVLAVAGCAALALAART
jgi:cobalt/nickel transport system permease protein